MNVSGDNLIDIAVKSEKIVSLVMGGCARQIDTRCGYFPMVSENWREQMTKPNQCHVI